MRVRLALLALIALAHVAALPGDRYGASYPAVGARYPAVAGAGAASGVPGLSGAGECNEACQTYLDTAAAVGDGSAALANHWHFSAYNGDDLGAGSEADPFQTMAKLEAVCEIPLTRCTLLDDGSVWSPNQLALDGSVTAFSVDDAVTWDNAGDGCPGTETGTVIGVDPAQNIVSVKRTSPAETAPIVGDELCSSDDAVERTVSAQQDTATVDSVLLDLSDPLCDRDDAPCYWIEGEAGAQARVSFDFLEQGGPVFHVTDDVSNQGRAFLQNLWLDQPRDHIVQVGTGAASGGVANLHNVRMETHDVGGGEFHTGVIMAEDSNGWATVTGSRSEVLSRTAHTTVGPAIITASEGGLMWASTGPIRKKATHWLSGGGIVFHTAGDVVLIGTDVIHGSGGDSHALVSTSATAAYQIRIARSSLMAAHGREGSGFLDWGAIMASPGVGGDLDIDVYESRLTGNNCIRVDTEAGRPVSVFARGVVLDECRLRTVAVDTGGEAATTLDLQGVYDPDDDGSLCLIGAAQSDTLAGCQSAAVAANASSVFFQQNSIDSASGARANGIAWSEADYPQLTGVTLATPGFDESVDPPEINCSGCDFLAAGFADGDLIWTTNIPISLREQHHRVWHVADVETTKLTMAAGERFNTGENDDGDANVIFRKWTYPRLVVHPESNAFGQLHAGPYCVTIPTRMPGGELPTWYTSEGVAVSQFCFNQG